MTDDERQKLIAELDRSIAEQRKRWPTIESMPAWHPVKQLCEQIEADVLEHFLKERP